MQTAHPTSVTDEPLSGLAVYSRDFVPLGRVVAVNDPRPAALADTLMGRRLTIDPVEQVQSALDGEDLVVSEAMIFDVSPDQDRVILNVSSRRVVNAARHLDRQR